MEIEASARLIAAAPELLAMVHCLREHVYTAGSGYLTKMVAEADALIARILQETQ